MATRTSSDLATAVMLDLGLLDPTASPAAEDSAHIIRRYTEALEELRDDGLVFWSLDAIPLEVFPGIVGYMSIVVGSAFGLPLNGNIDAALMSAKARLRRRVAKKSSGEATQFRDY